MNTQKNVIVIDYTYILIADCKHISLDVAVIHMLTITVEWLTLVLCIWYGQVEGSD